MTVLKGSMADDLAPAALLDIKPTRSLVLPNIAGSGQTEPNGLMFYDIADDLVKVVVNGVLKTVATV